MELKEILKRENFAQIGYVVHDIKKAKQEYSMLFACDVPETVPCGDFAVCQTKVHGAFAPRANSKLAFFELHNGVQLELIEPNEAPSVWRDHLDQYGEGIHHIAFHCVDTDETVKLLVEHFDAVIEQEGTYGDGSGRYVYLSVQDKLKCRIELLQSF